MNPLDSLRLVQFIADELKTVTDDELDAETFWDSLDGETDALDIIAHLITLYREAKAAESAMADLIEQYRDRKKRMEKNQRTLKRTIQKYLEAAGERRVSSTVGTAFITPGRMGVVVDDESLIPDAYMKTEKTPRASAILAAIEAGETVPGCRVDRGPDTLVIR